jgi:hypothetical protein
MSVFDKASQCDFSGLSIPRHWSSRKMPPCQHPRGWREHLRSDGQAWCTTVVRILVVFWLLFWLARFLSNAVFK